MLREALALRVAAGDNIQWIIISIKILYNLANFHFNLEFYSVKANPSFLQTQINVKVGFNIHHSFLEPFQSFGCSWCQLCQPSPSVRNEIKILSLASMFLFQVLDPQIWQMLLTHLIEVKKKIIPCCI